ncbi:MAG TPA: ATP-binding cassette domain-containing protein [Caulobacteraceae bacterium]
MPSRQAVLGIDQGAFFHGTRRIFSGVSFLLDDATTALVGENGVGKSTLLNCLSGELELNSGKIVRSRGLHVSHLPQEVPDGLAALTVRRVLERSLERVGAGGEDWRIDMLLDEIGVAAETADGLFGTLSGGWQRLILIAGAARLEAPDVLILDEPTNHLDIGHINTLETWLTGVFRLPLLVVSHDREFLNRVSTRTLFLRPDGIHAFKIPFAQAREELLRRDAAAGVRRKIEEKEIKRLEKVAARYHVWGQKNSLFHRRMKAVETRIDRIEKTKTEVYVGRERRLELGESEIEAKIALRVEGLRLMTPDGERKLLDIERLAIAAGDKVALLGVNGAGKSTLLAALAKAWSERSAHYDGSAKIRFNPASRLVYFDQTMRDLPLGRTLLELLTDIDGVSEREAVRVLAQAGFAFDRLRDPIALLSHGERSRLNFLKMKLLKPNFYLLDEPTSHLDIEGQEDLEGQLEETEVACVFVSHDRYFTRTAATRFLEFRRGRLIEVDEPDSFFDSQAA